MTEVTVFGSTFGVPELGQITYHDLMKISAVPLGDFGSATGQFIAGAISSAPVGTYSNTLQAQAAGLSMQEAANIISKYATANNRADLKEQIQSGDTQGAIQKLATEGTNISGLNRTGINILPVILLGAAALLIK